MNMKGYSLDYFFRTCSRKIYTKLTFVAIAFLISCTSALYVPTESQQTESASLTQLQAGRKLYVQKCGNCHTLHLPEKYSKPEWQHFLDEMQQKASINNLEKQQILKYLSKGL